MRAILLLAALGACRLPVPESDGNDATTHTDAADSDTPDTEPEGPRRNVVLVVTDDQRYDTMFAMPGTVERLGANGVTFERAYVTSPMCCPSRAATLSGGFYPHHNGVLANDPPNGGAIAFVDEGSLPVRLQEAGYATGLFGKYLNGYGDMSPYVPPGWTRFAGHASGDYLAWETVVGSTGSEPGEGEVYAGDTYSTDWIAAQALAFLDEHAADPFVLVLTPLAPHNPSQPAPEDEGSYADFAWRGGAYDEEDVTDKPTAVRAEPRWSTSRKLEIDEKVRDMVETLPAVDRMVVAVLDRLDALGVADETLVVVTSDNGYLWGEHRLTGKGWPYEESVRVPLLARWPGGATGTSDALVAGDLDIPATIEEFTDLPATGDGRSLGPILRGETPADWRDRLLIMNYTPGHSVWAGVVTRDRKVVVTKEGEREIYDLAADPFERGSLHATPPDGVDELWDWLEHERGMLVTTEAVSFEPYVAGAAPVRVVGGQAPYRFALDGGTLPPGLALDASTGTIGGKATESGLFSARIEVTDSSVSPYHGGPQRYIASVEVQVGPAAPMRLAPPETTPTGPGAAIVRVHPRRAGLLTVELSWDPQFDEARRIELPVEAGPVSVPVGDLLGGQRYYARAFLDGAALGDWSWSQR